MENQTPAMENLIVVTEGGATMFEYLLSNQLTPSHAMFFTKNFKELLPYLTKKDEVLIIINSLTDFSMVEVYALAQDLLDAKDALLNFTVVSNIPLGDIGVDYYIYDGDLFFGTMHQMTKKGLQPIQEANSSTNKKKKTKETKAKESVFLRNPIMERFVRYRIPADQKLKVYDIHNEGQVEVNEEHPLFNQLVFVDLFKTQVSKSKDK